MIESSEKRKQLAKWIVGIITICILIFLGIRYINNVADTIMWMIELISPLLVGSILALFLNVPLGFIERHLFKKRPALRKVKLHRYLSILLSLILVLGILIGIAFLVIPELVNAMSIVITGLMDALDQIAILGTTADYSEIPFGEYLSRIDIDWIQLQNDITDWLGQLGTTIMNMGANMLGSIASVVVDLVIGLVFAIYILSNKETLKQQICRLIRIWFPKKVGDRCIHVAAVCIKNFKLFVAGQTTEAVILGTLCTIGMLILRIPYAPMIGALVGVTALIPYVGAWIAAIVGAFMILTVNPFKALVFVIFLLILQQIEGNAIYPKVVGAKINLPAMWVLAAITVGGNLGGPIGMLFAVPTASAAYSLLREATEKREKRLKTSKTDN